MNTKEKSALRLIEAEASKGTKKAQERAEEMLRLFNNRGTDTCGWYGRLCEVASHTSKSRQVQVARQGRNDTCVKVNLNGKVRYIPAEAKTNGGRVEALFEANAPAFVVYSMNICNAGTSNLPRIIKPVVLRTEDFLKILKECNALKNTNGVNPQTAIQATSKKLYLRLSEATRFEADKVYNLEDIKSLA